MTFQVLIGSTPEEINNLISLNTILQWTSQIYDTYDPELVPFNADELDNLLNWIIGIRSLLTDFDIFTEFSAE